MANKIVKKDYFAVISSVFADFAPDDSFEVEGKGAVTAAQVLDFAAHEVELLTKKATGERKPTAKQIESAQRREAIQAILTGEAQTIADIKAQSAELEALSSHQMAMLLSPMVQDGQVVKTKVKGVTFYALAGAVE